MAGELSAYHRGVAASNRAAILDAAADLFLASGYDGTSLSRVAASAGVSKATLFKQFPTKAELFEATMLAAGGAPDAEPAAPDPGDLHAGLVSLGLAYVELLDRPRIAGLMRTVIAESPRFPELRQRTFDFGTLPVLKALRSYLRAAHEAGTADIGDVDTATTQFLGMIASAVFWPRLMHGTWSITAAQTRHVVDEAAHTIVARYARR